MAVPAYRRVADAIRDAIKAGNPAPGELLPSGTDLAQRYGISQETALKALRTLAREGWIHLAPRSRAVVRRRPRERIVVRDRAVYRDGGGYYFDQQAVDWRPVGPPRRTLGVPPHHIADLLGVPRGEDVIVRDRAMGPDPDGPAKQLATSYIPIEVAAEIPALRAENTGPGGIYDRIEEAFNQGIEWQETICARLPNDEEQERLCLPPTVPVLVITREARVRRGGRVMVVEVNETRMASEQFAVAYSVRRDESAAWPRADGGVAE